MKDILFECEGCRVLAEIDGLNLTWRYDGDYMYVTRTLLNENSYADLKRDLRTIYEAFNRAGDEDAVVSVFNILDGDDMSKYCHNDSQIHYDGRTHDEIRKYMDEVDDRIRLDLIYHNARYRPLSNRDRAEMERILNAYPNIRKEGYTELEHREWCGILSGLTWALGEEKVDPDHKW